jgi:hypothetical protein
VEKPLLFAISLREPQTLRHMLEMLQENNMRYLHTMVRIRDIDESLDFYVNKFGLEETRQRWN